MEYPVKNSIGRVFHSIDRVPNSVVRALKQGGVLLQGGMWSSELGHLCFLLGHLSSEGGMPRFELSAFSFELDRLTSEGEGGT